MDLVKKNGFMGVYAIPKFDTEAPQRQERIVG